MKGDTSGSRSTAAPRAGPTVYGCLELDLETGRWRRVPAEEMRRAFPGAPVRDKWS